MQDKSPAFNSKQAWLALYATIIMVFMTNIEFSAVNVTLPSISRSLHLSVISLAWIVNAYMFIWAIGVVPAGHIGDRIGKKKFFIIGTLLFAFASFLAGFSTNYAYFLVMRALQGIGGAIIFPMAASLAYMSFPPEERAKPVSILQGFSFIALASGPIIGGILIQYLSWRWVFFINLPLGILSAAVSFYVLKETQPSPASENRFDYPGIAILAVAVLSLLLFATNGNHWGFTSASSLTMLVVSIISFAILIPWELKHKNPVLIIDILKLKAFFSGMIGRTAANFCLVAFMFVLVLYLQNIRLFSPIFASNMFLPLTIAVAVLSFVTTKMSKHMQPRELALWGSGLLLIALFSFLLLSDSTSIIIIGFLSIIIGAGFGMTFPSFSTLAMQVLPPEKAGAGTGMYYLVVLTFGNALGIAIASMLLLLFGRHALTHQLAEYHIRLSAAQLHHVLGVFSGSKTHYKTLDLLPAHQSHLVLLSLDKAFMFGFKALVAACAIVVVISVAPLALIPKAKKTREAHG